MGNRVLMQCFSSERGNFGPVVYGHWSGGDAGNVARKLAARMKDRQGDLAYSSARLMQELIDGDEGNLGFGMWNSDHLLVADDSHGDAGVILIDVDNGHKCQCMGGYLKTGDDGFPIEDGEET